MQPVDLLLRMANKIPTSTLVSWCDGRASLSAVEYPVLTEMCVFSITLAIDRPLVADGPLWAARDDAAQLLGLAVRRLRKSGAALRVDVEYSGADSVGIVVLCRSDYALGLAHEVLYAVAEITASQPTHRGTSEIIESTYELYEDLLSEGEAVHSKAMSGIWRWCNVAVVLVGSSVEQRLKGGASLLNEVTSRILGRSLSSNHFVPVSAGSCNSRERDAIGDLSRQLPPDLGTVCFAVSPDSGETMPTFTACHVIEMSGFWTDLREVFRAYSHNVELVEIAGVPAVRGWITSSLIRDLSALNHVKRLIRHIEFDARSVQSAQIRSLTAIAFSMSSAKGLAVSVGNLALRRLDFQSWFNTLIDELNQPSAVQLESVSRVLNHFADSSWAVYTSDCGTRLSLGK